MSHIATNWAFSQKNLKPAEKLLLLCLADRHNPDQGCFPSQARLAEDANMSRSSINNILARLEELNLIRREKRQNEKTKRQQSTRYILGFEDEFAQEPSPDIAHGSEETDQEQEIEPCPEFGHGAVSNSEAEPCPNFDESRVQNLDTNPVRVTSNRTGDARERAREISDFVREICEAAGDPCLVEQHWWKQEAESGSFISNWHALGLTDADILEVVKRQAMEKPSMPRGPKALDAAMRRAAERARASRAQYRPIEERVAFWAERLKSERFIPLNALSAEVRRGLITRGLATDADLRARGL